MSFTHTELLYVWVQWLFISRLLGFNGLHTSVSYKSPDSTRVCTPVSSQGCGKWSQCDEKENEIYLLAPPPLLLQSKTDSWRRNEKWDFTETRPEMHWRCLWCWWAWRKWQYCHCVTSQCVCSEWDADPNPERKGLQGLSRQWEQEHGAEQIWQLSGLSAASEIILIIIIIILKPQFECTKVNFVQYYICWKIYNLYV